MKEYRIKEVVKNNGESIFTAQYRKKDFWGWSNWYDFHHRMDLDKWSKSLKEAKMKLKKELGKYTNHEIYHNP
jgi:hypothetical protein